MSHEFDFYFAHADVDSAAAAALYERLVPCYGAARLYLPSRAPAHIPAETALERSTCVVALVSASTPATWLAQEGLAAVATAARNARLDQLNAMLPTALEELVYRLGLPSQHLPSALGPQATRAMEMLRYLASENRLGELDRALPQGGAARRFVVVRLDGEMAELPPGLREAAVQLASSRPGDVDAVAAQLIALVPPRAERAPAGELPATATVRQVLSAALDLDRTAQWAGLHEPGLDRAHTYFLLHGEHIQDLRFFSERIHHQLSRGALRRVVALSYVVDGARPTRAAHWRMRLRDALAESLGAAGGLDELAALVLPQAGLFLLIELGCEETFDEPHADALTAFLAGELPRLIAQFRPAEAMHVLVASEFVRGSAGHHEKIERLMRQAEADERFPGIEIRYLPEVQLPTRAEVVAYLKNQWIAGRRLGPGDELYDEILALYDRLSQSGTMTFGDLAHRIDKKLGRTKR